MQVKALPIHSGPIHSGRIPADFGAARAHREIATPLFGNRGRLPCPSRMALLPPSTKQRAVLHHRFGTATRKVAAVIAVRYRAGIEKIAGQIAPVERKFAI